MPAPLLRFARWAWRLGEPTSPVPVYWLAVAVMLGVQLHRTIHDVDIFWQLRLGELTLAGGLPRTEPFLAGREGEPLAVVGWLGQVVFASVRRLGGWDLLRLFDAVVWLAGFAVVGGSLARRVLNQWVVVIGLWVGWFAAIGFASIRPQTFAVCCFGLLVVLVRSGLSARVKVLAGAGLLVLWQNLHPSAAVGVIYLAAAAVGEWGAYLLGRGTRPDFARVLLVLIAAAATLATPAGVDVFRIAAENEARSKWMRVTEWLPMWDGAFEFGRDHAAPVMAATVILLSVRGRRVRAADLLPAIVLTAMTTYWFRFVLFWGMAVIPVCVQCLTGKPIPEATPGRPKVRRAIAAAGFLLALLPLRIWPLNFADYYPFAGVEALKAEHVRGPVYCNYFWGGVLTDLGYPDWHPTHDGRYYLFSQQQLEDHFAAGRGEIPLAELEQRFRPVAFFLWPKSGRDDNLAAILAAAPGWRKIHEDGNCSVFVRR